MKRCPHCNGFHDPCVLPKWNGDTHTAPLRADAPVPMFGERPDEPISHGPFQTSSLPPANPIPGASSDPHAGRMPGGILQPPGPTTAPPKPVRVEYICPALGEQFAIESEKAAKVLADAGFKVLKRTIVEEEYSV